MIRIILVVGGANGIGLFIATELAILRAVEKVYIVDKARLFAEYQQPKFEAFQFDLTSEDYYFFVHFSAIDSLIITAGFGKLSLFKDVSERHNMNSFSVNTISRVETCA